ncbi:MAG: hypothetical protein AB8E15_07000 [Bdellovibrionales bacterium]
MRTRLLGFFTTMVLGLCYLTAYSATTNSGQDPTAIPETKTNPKKTHGSKYDFDITELKSVPKPKSLIQKPIHKVSRYTVSTKLGIGRGEGSNLFGFGTSYTNYIAKTPYTLSFDIFNNGNGIISLAKWDPQDWLRSWQAYTNYGFALHLEPDEGFGSFINYKNYGFHGSIGIENIIDKPLSQRWEISYSLTTSTNALFINYALAWSE